MPGYHAYLETLGEIDRPTFMDEMFGRFSPIAEATPQQKLLDTVAGMTDEERAALRRLLAPTPVTSHFLWTVDDKGRQSPPQPFEDPWAKADPRGRSILRDFYALWETKRRWSELVGDP